MTFILFAITILLSHIAGKLIPRVDALSRLQKEDANDVIFFNTLLDCDPEESDVNLQSSLMEDINEHFKRSEFYTRIINRILKGNWQNLTNMEKVFRRYSKNLRITNGLIFYNNRLYISEAYRTSLLKSIHDTHMGIEQTLKKAKMCMWWPGLSKDVETYVNSCYTCSDIRFRGKSSLDTWPKSQSWEDSTLIGHM